MKDLSLSLLNSPHWPDFELTDENFISNAVMMSLFCDQRSDEIPVYEISHRGYWADSLEPKMNPLGSKIWTLSAQSLDEDSLESAIQFGFEALSWMISKDLATDIAVDGEIRKNSIVLFIQIVTPSGNYPYEIDLARGFHGIF